jgi:hypothetical protein
MIIHNAFNIDTDYGLKSIIDTLALTPGLSQGLIDAMIARTLALNYDCL